MGDKGSDTGRSGGDFSPSPLASVLAFYRVVGKPIRGGPTADIPEDEVGQILDLLDEERAELQVAFTARDIEGIADALADIAYVVYGAALQVGIDLDRVLAEVHQANMSKPNADGSIERARDGKILRGDSYRPPSLAEVLGLDELLGD